MSLGGKTVVFAGNGRGRWWRLLGDGERAAVAAAGPKQRGRERVMWSEGTRERGGCWLLEMVRERRWRLLGDEERRELLWRLVLCGGGREGSYCEGEEGKGEFASWERESEGKTAGGKGRGRRVTGLERGSEAAAVATGRRRELLGVFFWGERESEGGSCSVSWGERRRWWLGCFRERERESE